MLLRLTSGLSSRRAAGFAPCRPIIEGAGGVITTWDGGDPSKGGAIVAAGDRRVHEAAIVALAANG